MQAGAGASITWKCFVLITPVAESGPRAKTTGGRCEIRTHEELAPLPVFKTGAFNRSANLPSLTVPAGLGSGITSLKSAGILASGAGMPTNRAGNRVGLAPPQPQLAQK